LRSTELADREAEAFQAFIGACRKYWGGPMLAAVERAADAFTIDPGPDAYLRLEQRLQGNPTYGYFCWLERHLQRLKYASARGVVASLSRQRDRLEAELSAPVPDGLLSLDPRLRPPGYYRDCDIHQHPGGLWDDPIAGAVYHASASQPGGVVGRRDLHARFTQLVMDQAPGLRLADLGCGFGKSALPFARARSDTSVSAVDLSAPCLRLAAQAAAREQRRNIRYLQRDARDTGLPSQSFDVVTSTMLLHEMPPDAIAATLREAYRLLVPGGISIHLDFLPPDDPFLRLLYFGHSQRNNEPFMALSAEFDWAEAHRSAGFTQFRTTPFEDEDGALTRPIGVKWRFPWTVIAAVKTVAS